MFDREKYRAEKRELYQHAVRRGHYELARGILRRMLNWRDPRGRHESVQWFYLVKERGLVYGKLY